MGCKDQIFAGHGGFLHIAFSPKDYTIKQMDAIGLESYLMLFFTGFQRTASEIAKTQVETMSQHINAMQDLQILTRLGFNAIIDKQWLTLGSLLHESWEIKKTLSPLITNPQIDYIYERARSAGARGGKLCGAGGGGMMLLFVEPEFQDKVRSALNDCIEIPFAFEPNGCRFSQSTE